jgi:homoserine dehydrogenase
LARLIWKGDGQVANEAIGVGLIGCGTVGSGVVELLVKQADLYARRLGRPLELRGVLVRPQDVDYKTEHVPEGKLLTDAEAFFALPDMHILVELGGGRGVISQFVRRALSEGKHVVTANKALLAAEGPELFALARENNVSIGFEASCGGGIPIITALNCGIMANHVQALYGILNGTCNYILTEMTQKNKDYATALAEAQAEGFAEADPTLDVNGGDTAHKLAILASLAYGVKATDDQVRCVGIDTLDLDDVKFGSELGYEIKLLGIAERVDAPDAAHPKLALSVQPCFVHAYEQLAQVSGPFNALSVFGNFVGHTMYYGRGAGREPTASAVVSDVLNTASGWYGQAFGAMRIWPDQQQDVQLVDLSQVTSRWYLRFDVKDEPGVLAKLCTILGESGISIQGVIQHESKNTAFVPLVITTHEASQGALQVALATIEQLPTVDKKPVCIRIADMPDG